MSNSTSQLQILDILGMDMDYLDKLPDEKLEELLAPLIPAARTSNKTYEKDQCQDMLEKLSKMMNI
jgi:hypothetical protein